MNFLKNPLTPLCLFLAGALINAFTLAVALTFTNAGRFTIGFTIQATVAVLTIAGYLLLCYLGTR